MRVNSRADPISSPMFSSRPAASTELLGFELGEVAAAVERGLQQVAGAGDSSAAAAARLVEQIARTLATPRAPGR